jgi:hypothetical protein
MPFKESYTNQPRMDLFLHKEHTAKKENDIFLIYGNSDGIDCKVIYERKTKFSSYIWKFRWDQVQSHI